MAHSDTWSTRTNAPSVKSSRFNSSSQDPKKSTKSNSVRHQANDTPSQVADKHDYSSERASEYAADPINPNPGYEYWSAEESKDAHRAKMRKYLEDYDVIWSHASQ
ncbi:hypothetical protein DSL72_008544 [Monilinia vaccinii-corymbosi]|uniref:Uncharacterized protein n=1 Tax=Monilinia vaccinii-corymbosi TaxID=61207 RepID=A0A8A3PPS4_9HELO|nr:hypothetical protein DSL72_008544 [Monilinia vaccinii-corymbosi]